MSAESDMHYAEERTKKITEALYRVTDLFSDKEPLKWTLRSAALEILDAVLAIESPARAKKTEGDILKLLSLLDLAQAGSFISSLNFDVLKSEYLNLSAFLLSPVERPENLLPTFFDSEKTQSKEEKAMPKPVKEAPLPPQESEEKPVPRGMKQIGSFIGHSMRQDYAYIGEGERQNMIVDYLKRQPGYWASIGDVVAIFKNNLSEKTVQRDLAELVDKGIIDKQGDKRWRRYSFKKREGEEASPG